MSYLKMHMFIILLC